MVLQNPEPQPQGPQVLNPWNSSGRYESPSPGNPQKGAESTQQHCSIVRNQKEELKELLVVFGLLILLNLFLFFLGQGALRAVQPKMKGRVCSLYCGFDSIFHSSCSLWCAAEQESGPRTRATFKTTGEDSRVPSIYVLGLHPGWVRASRTIQQSGFCSGALGLRRGGLLPLVSREWKNGSNGTYNSSHASIPY